MQNPNPRLILLASGSGSNVESIMAYLRSQKHTFDPLILCNNPKAGVIERAQRLGVDMHVFDRAQLNSEAFLTWIQSFKPDLMVLAGFLWKIPENWVRAFPQKIINIHPALLPKFGGKGMYGHHIHEAVVAAGETESGITIHYVNEHYDEGGIIQQVKCLIEPGTQPDALSEQVLRLEHHYLPRVVESLLFHKQES